MKALLLGGTGVAGKGAAALLARQDWITELGLASRNLESATRLAAQIGVKARPEWLDLMDVPRLAECAAAYDVLINAAGPTSLVQVPALRAAIRAGVHYCDLGVNGRPAEEALELDGAAQSARITAVIGSGWCAVTQWMAVHAARQLDSVEEIFSCMQFDYSPGSFFSPEKFLERARETGRVETSGIDLMEAAAGPVKTFRQGRFEQVEPGQYPMDVVHPSGAMLTAYPNDSIESVLLPRTLPDVPTIFTSLILTPPALNQLYLRQGRRVASGETDAAGAMLAFYETAAADPDRWLAASPGCPAGWWMWVVAHGIKDGRKARFVCWPAMLVDWTSLPLVLLVKAICENKITRRGVLWPAECYQLEAMVQQANEYLPEQHRGQPLIHQRFEWLET